MITARNICKEYCDASEKIVIFDNLNFTIHSGETIALMGQSGAGKSTLLHLLGGFDKPESGHIEINSQSISSMSDARLSRFRRQFLGMVFQQYNLIPSLTARDNISFVRRLNGLPAEDEFTRELVHALQLQDRLDHYPSQLSGGEQQRVAIARAIATQPLLILADEPTGNLDEQTAAQVMTMLMRAVALQQSTLLLVTHSPTTASYLDKTWRLEQGQLLC
ncbi:ABC transporter ATP-binding protein [Amphritea balenae]|uniref:ABC transporter ATP-binding protein n=1 Tax=Amphritea balenae TaxID=452629 RepID=UPI0019A8197C|nr:ABC transporter ATP-binding protein [Amphritea balenae]GGK79824.1 macrolide ABC transporter ATP-binding protein [Amphritea balenae]